MKTLVVKCALSAIAIIGCAQSASLAQYKMEDRINDAKRLIQLNEQFQAHAKKFHIDANNTIAESNELTQAATKLEGKATSLKNNASKMSPNQKAKAQNQYKQDLNDFQAHAQQYQDHLKNFQKTVGECHADEREYNLNLQQHELHVDQFHIPLTTMRMTIRPPHICGAMDVSFHEARSYANQMLMDRKRMVEAEQTLQNAENNLQTLVQQAPQLRAKALTNSKREQAEQQIAVEFAKLKDEYNTLQVEHATLTGKDVSTTMQSVHATIKH